MKVRFLHFVVGLTVTLLLTVFSEVLAQTDPTGQETQPQGQEDTLDCLECHEDIYTSWKQSAHGQGLSCGECHLGDLANHARQGHATEGGAQACMDCHTTGYDPITDTWKADDIHCIACHSPVDPTHPDVPVPIDRSAELCGQCHIQAHFEWQESSHGKAGVVCVSCHSQHATSLIANSVSEQCANCHETYTEGFVLSAHYAEGLSCANCHLAPEEGPIGEGSSKRHHSFHVDVKTCVVCHGDGLHNVPDALGTSGHFTFKPGASDPTDAMTSSAVVEVSPEPEPITPFGFVTVGGITLGLGIGGVIVGTATITVPWFNKLYRRTRRQKL